MYRRLSEKIKKFSGLSIFIALEFWVFLTLDLSGRKKLDPLTVSRGDLFLLRACARLGRGMRIRQALAPALQPTLLGLIATMASSFLSLGQQLPILRDVTRKAGLNLVTTCGTPQKKFIIEGNGSGCA